VTVYSIIINTEGERNMTEGHPKKSWVGWC